MAAAESHLAGLSEADRERLEAWLVEFDASWDERRLALRVRQLLPTDPLRRPALIEMVKIDLERRWARGQRVRLESYLKALPELGGAETVPVDLILAECKVQQRFQLPLDLEALARRFPRRAEEVQRLVQRANTDPESPPKADNVAPGEPTPLPAPAAARVGVLPEQFGRYRILRKLGQGGMGAVYLARDEQLDRQVALKVPHLTAADGPEVRQRFYTEARAAATIDHPNICPVHDVGEIDGIHYLTMAYVEGTPLSERIAEDNPFSAEDAATLVRTLALALQEAHARAVIHRDLKPSNIIVNRRQQPVVMDFGLARRERPDDPRLTRSGVPLGTPAYMPPEQVTGNLDDMGPGCDIYSLGVILFELLTGRRPFEGPLAAVWGQILAGEPPKPTEFRPDLDPRLEAICLKAMARKVADRHASMAELAAALESYLSGGDLPTRPVQRLPRSAGAGRRLWRTVAAALLLLVLLALGTFLFTHWQDKATRRSAATALREGREALQEKEYDRALTLLDEAVRLDPSNGDAWYHRGHAHAIRKHEGQALADLTKAIALDSKRKADAYNLRGLLHGGQGKAAQALADFNEAIRLDPRHVKAHLNRASTRASREKYELALADYTRALEIDPTCVEACNGRGTVYQAWGDYKQAISEYDQALRIKPTARVYNNRGFARACQGRHKDAIADYGQAIRLDRNWAVPYANRGLSRYQTGMMKASLEDFNKAIALAPATPLFFRGRAKAYSEMGYRAKAEADRKKAQQLENTPRP